MTQSRSLHPEPDRRDTETQTPDQLRKPAWKTARHCEDVTIPRQPPAAPPTESRASSPEIRFTAFTGSDLSI